MAAPGFANADHPQVPPEVEGLFDETDDVDDDSDAHARAQEDGEEEKKESVHLGSAVVWGLLLKQVSAAALESPEVVANMGIKKIKSGVASGKLRPNFNKASVMRVGKNATVCGIIRCPIEPDMTDDEKDYLGADDGFIMIILQACAASLLNAVVHDSSKSPMKLIHMYYKLMPDRAVYYDIAFQRFGKIEYKESGRHPL